MCCVRPGVLLTKARRFRWASALIAEDFPAFDLPAKATSGPAPEGSCSHSAAVVRNSARRNGRAASLSGLCAAVRPAPTRAFSVECTACWASAGSAERRPITVAGPPGDSGNPGMRHALLLTATCLVLGAPHSALAQTSPAKPDLAKAKQIVDTVCAACHGADGNSANPANPTLAGQDAGYLTLQLMHFKDGIRSNAVMAPMTANLSPEDMAAVA